MPNNPAGQDRPLNANRALWASIVFPFSWRLSFYVASPFSIYFYGVYGPGLDWLEESSLTSWTTRFFFPQLLESNKPSVIVVFETSGMILFYTGSLGFALGAFQIYRENCLKINTR